MICLINYMAYDVNYYMASIAFVALPLTWGEAWPHGARAHGARPRARALAQKRAQARASAGSMSWARHQRQ